MRIYLHRMCSLKKGKEDTFLSYCIQLLLSFIIHAKIMDNILWSLLKGKWLLILIIGMSQLLKNLNKIKLNRAVIVMQLSWSSRSTWCFAQCLALWMALQIKTKINNIIIFNNINDDHNHNSFHWLNNFWWMTWLVCPSLFSTHSKPFTWVDFSS